jgi:trehalose 6-phosphate phosphatase
MSIGGAPPLPDRDWAFFFDVDGTIVELASSPSAVRLDPAMHALLRQLFTASAGALALVTGRHAADIDAIFSGPPFPVASQHGLERRDVKGAVTRAATDPDAIAAARIDLQDAVGSHPRLLLEDKGSTLALHYRAAPALASFAHRMMRAARQRAGPGYQLQQGKCVIELVPKAVDKGRAILEFMAEPPFRGRTPVFVGDDLTDEAGFAAVNGLGGYSVKVGNGASAARWRLASVDAVKAWLECGAAARWAAQPRADGATEMHTAAHRRITTMEPT